MTNDDCDRFREEELDESEYPDPDEGDDQSETVPCSRCGAHVYEDAVACPECGHYMTADTSVWSGRPLWWILLGLLGVIVLVIVLMFVPCGG